jgi:hypothetical protein
MWHIRQQLKPDDDSAQAISVNQTVQDSNLGTHQLKHSTSLQFVHKFADTNC